MLILNYRWRDLFAWYVTSDCALYVRSHPDACPVEDAHFTPNIGGISVKLSKHLETVFLSRLQLHLFDFKTLDVADVDAPDMRSHHWQDAGVIPINIQHVG
jgi:hypothetical protein